MIELTESTVRQDRQIKYSFDLDTCSVTLEEAPEGAASTPSDRAVSLSAPEGHNSSALPNSARSKQFAALTDAIRRLRSLHPDHHLYVNHATCDYASEVLALLGSQTDLSAPKLLPQDAEALALTWAHGRQVRVLSLDPEDVSIMDLDKISQGRSVQGVPDPMDLFSMLAIMGTLPKASTSE